MAGDWTTTTLADCADWMSGGTPSKANPAYWTGDIPWVSAKDMKSFRLRDAEDHISQEAVGNGGKMVRAGDILLLVRGMTLHNDVPICMAMRDMAFNQDIKAIRAVPGVDSVFLAYWLLAHKPDLLASVDSAGHGTGRLVTETLKKRAVRLPPLPEQKRIAHILGTLDDKIELNRRMNATLEAMSRAIFKSWFVDFDPVRQKAVGKQPVGMDAQTAALFPDSFEDSEIGEVPSGWEVTPLPEIVEVNPARSLRRGETAPYLDMANMPTIGHTPDELIARPFASGTRFMNGDTLMARITPCLENGKTAFIDCLQANEVAWGSTEFIVLRPHPPLPPEFAYCLARDDGFREFAIQSMTGSSGRQRVPAESLGHFRLARPPAGLCEVFAERVQPCFRRIRAAADESRTLATLRDTLLPKLLSGEVRVPEAEEAVGEVLG